WAYDAGSRRTVQLQANSTRASYSHDAADRLTRLANIKSDGTTLSSFSYSMDNVGNRTRVIEADGTRVTWTYDDTYQLRGETRGGAHAYDITHTYDPLGNQKLKVDSGTRTTATFDAANQIVYTLDNNGRTTFTFDAGGNQSTQLSPSAARTTQVWDVDNRMTQVRLPGGARNTSTYNGDGQRVQREDSSGLANLVWDQENILLETTSGGLTQSQSTLELQAFESLISQRRSGNSLFHLFD